MATSSPYLDNNKRARAGSYLYLAGYLLAIECGQSVVLTKHKGFSVQIHYLISHIAITGKLVNLPLTGKLHNPNYTADAVRYLNGYFKELTRKIKRKELVTPQQQKAFVDSYDWHRMTTQDDAVWQEIFATLDS